MAMGCHPSILESEEAHQKKSHSIHFIWCDCGYYDCIGLPDAHVLCLVGEWIPNMFHIDHWKVYNGDCGDNSNMGRLMIQAEVRL